MYIHAAKIDLTDREIVSAILERNSRITKMYLYVRCYPLFKAIYDNYYTDCETCLEFINEIYVHIMTLNPNTGKCKLQNFRFESSFTTWLKTVCIYYCYGRYEKRIWIADPIIHKKANNKNNNDSDSFLDNCSSIEIEFDNLNHYDVERLLNLMPNQNYKTLIRLRYLEEKTNEETAAALNINMANYYNMHLRAKRQYEEIVRKEEGYV